MGEITITKEEFQELVEIRSNLKAFKRYLAKKYSIDRDTCIAILGIEVDADDCTG